MKRLPKRMTALVLLAYGAPNVFSAADLPVGALWPACREVFLIEVANGSARQFDAVTGVDLPGNLGASPAATRAVRLVELNEGGLAVARLPVQLDVSAGQSRLFFPLTGQTPPGSRRRFLLYANAPGDVPADEDRIAPAESPFDTLTVRAGNGQVTVANRFYETAQPEKGGGGLITSVTFVNTGLTTRQFTYDERIYNSAVANMASLYCLRDDSQATTTVRSQGPIRTVVEAKAHYTRGGATTTGNARAVYRYEFTAGSPLIAVSADVTQDVEEPWTELHFLQLSTKGTAFPIWRAGDGLAGLFTGTKQSRHVARWGIMSNGADAVGLLSRDGLIWYDDPHGYCNYFQFPVTQWKTKTHHFDGRIYIGPLQPHAIMEQWFARLTDPPKVTISPLSVMGEVRNLMLGMPSSPTPSDGKDYEQALVLSILRRDPAIFRNADLLDLVRDSAFLKIPPSHPDDHHWEIGIGKERDYAAFVRRRENLLWLANRLAVFRFDLAGGGRLAQALDLRGRCDLIGYAPSFKSPLWRVSVRRNDGTMVTTDSLTAGQPRTNRPARDDRTRNRQDVAVTVEWPAFAVQDCKGTLAVRVEMRIGPDRPVVSARLSIDNKLADAGLWSVEFPVLAPVAPPGRTDVAIPRLNWGKLHERCAGEQSGEYPSGWWPMQYLSVTDGPSTLYLGAHDPQCGAKRFSLKAGGEFHFDLLPPDMGKPGASFTMDHDIVFGPLTGDWFDAARFYREWALQQVWMSRGPLDKREDIPRKLRDGLVWLLLSGEPKSVVPTAIAAQEFLRVPVGIHWYSWHQIPFDVNYPHYFPVKEGFKEAVKTLTDRGIYVMPYINGRLWDSGLPDFNTVARPASCKGIDGKPYIEEYGSGAKLAVMCPSTPLWQDKMCDVVGTLLNEYGVNAVYLDQIASAGPRQCFDAAHGHRLGGGTWWAAGYWKMMDRIQQIGATRTPDVFFTTENNAESYSHNIDAFLIWNPRRPNMIPINAVVYGGMRVHFANRVHPADSDMAFAMKVGRDWLWGTQLGWMEPFYLAPEHRAKGEYFRRLAHARMRAAPFLGYGQMLRPPTITCDAVVSAEWYGESALEHSVTWSAVGGACWRAPDGRIGVIFTNYDTAPRTFRFTLHEEVARQVGSFALWCEPTERGLVPFDPIGCPDGSFPVACIPGRDVLILEAIPCASAAERDERRKTLPVKSAPATQQAVAAPSMHARLDLPFAPTPPGQPVLGKLTVGGFQAAEPNWLIRLNLPDGCAVEPSGSFPLRPSTQGRSEFDLLIYPEPNMTGDQRVGVELARRLGWGTLRVAAPKK